jgi:Spx/MgsR family transcriptional regulator
MKNTAITVYGIPNCDSVKKARTWLSEQGLDYVFHDFKKQGVPEAELAQWVAAAGWETVLNRKGTTWRKLEAATQAAVVDSPSAQALMREQASVIKRPVIAWPSGAITVGYTPECWPA